MLETHAWQRPLLGGGVVSPEEAGALVCAQFDSGGELLVVGSEEGVLSVHATAALLAACGSNPGGGAAGGEVPAPALQRLGTADPLLVLDSRLSKLQAVRWNGANENVVGLASSATRSLPLYDLQHTQVGGVGVGGGGPCRAPSRGGCWLDAPAAAAACHGCHAPHRRR